MVNCCVPFCISKQMKGSNIGFHKFPTNELQRRKWVVAVSRQGNKRGSFWIPSKSSVICSKHFKEKDYSISTRKRVLLPNAIPTVFDIFPRYRQIIQTKRKPSKRRHSGEDLEESLKRIKKQH